MYNIFDDFKNQLSNKQAELVSGTNIKTINGVSVLGSGDLSISGGGGVSDGDKGDITVSASGAIWTIDNLAVTDAKINDVAATKVTEDSTHRFTTDAEKTTWNGKADLVGGKVPSSQIPSIAITEFLGTVANQAAMLALIGEQGDWCIRSDEQSGYVLIGNTPTLLADWQKIVTPASPVSSVNGQVGTVVLGKSDVGLGNCDNTSDANKPVSTAQATAIGLKQDTLVSGTNIKTIGGSSILGAGNIPIPDPAGWTTIVKSANQDVTNNATFQDDTELQFSVVAGGHYMVEMSICWSGNNATSDYDPRFLITAGVLNGGGIALVSDQPTPRQIVSASASVGFGSWNLSSTSIDFLNSAVIQFNFNPSANAIFKFQFRNASAGVGRISRTWKGSILKYKRID